MRNMGTYDLRGDAKSIFSSAIESSLPHNAVVGALAGLSFDGNIIVVAIGKAAYTMAQAAHSCLGSRISGGVVITKYGHATGCPQIGPMAVYEAGHPITDENSVLVTEKALAAVKGLNEKDTVLFLVSGGGSSLFEKPLISLDELKYVNNSLLACGADIKEINTIRKRLSAVKGGRFALACSPARVVSIILSDIVGNPLDMIASGPAYKDGSTCEDAQNVVKKYSLGFSEKTMELLRQETPKSIADGEVYVAGSVEGLCATAAKKAESLGYSAKVLTTSLCCEAKAAGDYLAKIAEEHKDSSIPLAFIAGGETVVKLRGSGMGGRNQELALSAARAIGGMENVCIFSVGSDGTDGPTDAAGGIVDGGTKAVLERQGISIAAALDDNDSYNALRLCDGLIKTGPTGTNVNDICGVLIKNRES